MGHYDSSYEHDREIELEFKRIQRKKEKESHLIELFVAISEISTNCLKFIDNKEKFLDEKLKMRVYDIQRELEKIYKEL